MAELDLDKFERRRQGRESKWQEARDRMADLVGKAREDFSKQGAAAYQRQDDDRKKAEFELAEQELNAGTNWQDAAMSGMAAGSAFGPWGALAGAALGGIGGGIKAHFAQEDYTKKTGKHISGDQQRDLFFRGAVPGGSAVGNLVTAAPNLKAGFKSFGGGAPAQPSNLGNLDSNPMMAGRGPVGTNMPQPMAPPPPEALAAPLAGNTALGVTPPGPPQMPDYMGEEYDRAPYKRSRP